MHCRPSCPTNNSTCSSFLSAHSDNTNTLNLHTSSFTSSHDQIPVPQRRRRLEDPVITHASNYYAINPRQTSPSSQTLPLPLSRRIRQKSKDKSIYCDLYNLLERPPPVKPRKKHTSNDSSSCRSRRSIVYKNIHTKIKDINERKRHQQQQSCYYNEEKYQKDKLLSKQQYDQLQDKKCIYQRHVLTKGFLRRVVRNYFCMPMTVTNGEFLN